MPCKTCGKDCKCLRMMSKRSCGVRSCDSGCTCPCNTASSVRSLPPAQDGQTTPGGGNGQGPSAQAGCCCAGSGEATLAPSAGCGSGCSC